MWVNTKFVKLPTCCYNNCKVHDNLFYTSACFFLLSCCHSKLNCVEKHLIRISSQLILQFYTDSDRRTPILVLKVEIVWTPCCYLLCDIAGRLFGMVLWRDTSREYVGRCTHPRKSARLPDAKACDPPKEP